MIVIDLSIVRLSLDSLRITFVMWSSKFKGSDIDKTEFKTAP